VRRASPFIFLALGLALFASACAGVAERAVPPVAAPPPAALPPPTPPAEPEAPPVRPEARRPAQTASTTLLADASQLERTGDLTRAGAVLERALRISPEDPLIWNRLAALRLREQKPHEAEQLARKSNQMASGDLPLQARNWRIIASARRMAGDPEGAGRADAKARDLLQAAQ
jgi:predicted Zn-dependent protease